MKIRKFTAVLLVLALLALPVFALGETASASPWAAAAAAGRSTKTTVTFVPGEGLAADPSLAPVADLLKALRLESVVQEKANAVLLQSDLFLQDKSSLSLTEVVSPEGQVTLKSNLFGQKAISFNMEEYMQWLISQLELQGEKEMASFYRVYIKLYSALMQGDMSVLPQLDQQSLQQDLITPAYEWFTNLVSVPVVTEGTFESDKHDAASTQTVYSLSAAQMKDLVSIVANWAGKDANLDAILAFVSSMDPEAGDLGASKADIQAKIKAMPEEFAKNAAAALQKPFTFTVLTDNSGNPVAYEIGISVFGEDKEKAETEVLAGYYVKTGADGKNDTLSFHVVSGTDTTSVSFSAKEEAAGEADHWQLAMNVKADSADVFTLKMDYAGQETADKDAWKLNIEAGPAGQTIGVVLDGSSSTAANGPDVRKEGKVDVLLAGQTAPLATIAFVTETGEPVDIPSFSDADVVRPGKMTQEELQAWNNELSVGMLTQLGQIMQNLPPSVTMLISGGAAF